MTTYQGRIFQVIWGLLIAFLILGAVSASFGRRRTPSPEDVALRCHDLCERSESMVAEIDYTIVGDEIEYSCACIPSTYLVDTE